MGDGRANVVRLTDGPREPKTEGRTLTPEEARSLLQAAGGERLEAAFVVMLSLGLRRGEVFGLRWTDIDFESKVITVAQALSRVGSRLVLGPPKTERSRRKINFPVPVATSLRAHKKRQAAERLVVGESWPHTDLVFTSEVGTPLDPANFRHSFDRVAAKAGLVGWHPHELRHSCASILLAQGVPIEVVSRVSVTRRSGSLPTSMATSSIRNANRRPKRWQKHSGRSLDCSCVTANRERGSCGCSRSLLDRPAFRVSARAGSASRNRPRIRKTRWVVESIPVPAALSGMNETLVVRSGWTTAITRYCRRLAIGIAQRADTQTRLDMARRGEFEWLRTSCLATRESGADPCGKGQAE